MISNAEPVFDLTITDDPKEIYIKAPGITPVKKIYRVNFQKAFSKNKFNAKKQEYAGRWYHSKKEASYAAQLDWQIKAGEITEWKPQHKIDLKVNGIHICNYFIDFRAVKKDGTVQYIEVKGFETAEWQIKWKILLAIKNETLEPGCELIVIK